MKIPIRVNTVNFYKTLLTLINKFPPIRGMREREIDVLAEIMKQNYLNKHVDISKRHELSFSRSSRLEMQKNLGMDEVVFNNYLSSLRKKKVLAKDNRLLPFLNIIPEKDYELTINFTIND